MRGVDDTSSSSSSSSGEGPGFTRETRLDDDQRKEEMKTAFISVSEIGRGRGTLPLPASAIFSQLLPIFAIGEVDPGLGWDLLWLVASVVEKTTETYMAPFLDAAKKGDAELAAALRNKVIEACTDSIRAAKEEKEAKTDEKKKDKS